MDNFMSDKPCACCGLEGEGYVCFHHEYGQKAYPEHKYKPWNLIPVCLIHHNMIHSNGTVAVSERFKRLENWLVDNDWYVCSFMKKWMHELK